MVRLWGWMGFVGNFFVGLKLGLVMREDGFLITCEYGCVGFIVLMNFCCHGVLTG